MGRRELNEWKYKIVWPGPMKDDIYELWYDKEVSQEELDTMSFRIRENL